MQGREQRLISNTLQALWGGGKREVYILLRLSKFVISPYPIGRFGQVFVKGSVSACKVTQIFQYRLQLFAFLLQYRLQFCALRVSRSSATKDLFSRKAAFTYKRDFVESISLMSAPSDTKVITRGGCYGTKRTRRFAVSALSFMSKGCGR